MNIYSTVMFCLGAAFLLPCVLLSGGETGWLRSFDRSAVKDKRKYAKFLGRILGCFLLTFLVSGLAGLVSIPAAVIVLAAGIILSFVLAVKKAGNYYK